MATKAPPRLQMNMTLEPELEAKLEAYHARTGVPKSAIAKRLLAAFLDGKIRLNELPAVKP